MLAASCFLPNSWLHIVVSLRTRCVILFVATAVQSIATATPWLALRSRRWVDGLGTIVFPNTLISLNSCLSVPRKIPEILTNTVPGQFMYDLLKSDVPKPWVEGLPEIPAACDTFWAVWVLAFWAGNPAILWGCCSAIPCVPLVVGNRQVRCRWDCVH